MELELYGKPAFLVLRVFEILSQKVSRIFKILVIWQMNTIHFRKLRSFEKISILYLLSFDSMFTVDSKLMFLKNTSAQVQVSQLHSFNYQFYSCYCSFLDLLKSKCKQFDISRWHDVELLFFKKFPLRIFFLFLNFGNFSCVTLGGGVG